jgi:hypothetical protein
LPSQSDVGSSDSARIAHEALAAGAVDNVLEPSAEKLAPMMLYGRRRVSGSPLRQARFILDTCRTHTTTSDFPFRVHRLRAPHHLFSANPPTEGQIESETAARRSNYPAEASAQLRADRDRMDSPHWLKPVHRASGVTRTHFQSEITWDLGPGPFSGRLMKFRHLSCPHLGADGPASRARPVDTCERGPGFQSDEYGLETLWGLPLEELQAAPNLRLAKSIPGRLEHRFRKPIRRRRSLPCNRLEG